ncbi:unnamed protein product [Linum tenue]|uniref:Uncharacterized protein n=1 Tax=Linum tenue TaxID=586396 RepID=A0AAV0KS36_9ROSI|nr:unnamed protein product [Linum tenue]
MAPGRLCLLLIPSNSIDSIKKQSLVFGPLSLSRRQESYHDGLIS